MGGDCRSCRGFSLLKFLILIFKLNKLKFLNLFSSTLGLHCCPTGFLQLWQAGATSAGLELLSAGSAVCGT